MPVVLGTAPEVTAVPGQSPALLIDKAQKNSITTQITLEEQVTAPVSAGQRLGTLTIRAGEQILRQIPMVAEQPVERLTYLQLFLFALRKLSMGA